MGQGGGSILTPQQVPLPPNNGVKKQPYFKFCCEQNFPKFVISKRFWFKASELLKIASKIFI